MHLWGCHIHYLCYTFIFIKNKQLLQQNYNRDEEVQKLIHIMLYIVYIEQRDRMISQLKERMSRPNTEIESQLTEKRRSMVIILNHIHHF